MKGVGFTTYLLLFFGRHIYLASVIAIELSQTMGRLGHLLARACGRALRRRLIKRMGSIGSVAQG